MNTKNKRNKIYGCLFGGAVGDALGYGIEFIRGIREKEHTRYQTRGIISDDTQMTLFTAVGILNEETRAYRENDSASPVQGIYHAYLDWLDTQTGHHSHKKVSWIKDIPELNVTRAPGNCCLQSLSSQVMGTVDHPLNQNKGCGGVMRVAPTGIYFKDPKDAGRIAAEANAITHGHPLGIISSYVFGSMIHFLIHHSITISEALSAAIKQFNYHFNNFDEKNTQCFIELINKAINLSRENISDPNAIKLLGEGWVAEEAFAIALYSCLKYENSFEDAVVCSVNHDGDSDSTGAIAGNLMGASLGYLAIPAYYLDTLELKDVLTEIAEDLSAPLQNSIKKKGWMDKYYRG